MSMNAQGFGGGGGTVVDASETTAGKIRIATSAEAAAGTSDVIAMTPLTVKEVVDASLVGGVEYKGTFNATTGLTSSGGTLAAAEKGDMYVIDTIGTIYGQTWAVGDHLLINEDMGGSVTNSKIDKVDNTDQVTSVNGLTGPVVLSGDDLAADHSATHYTAANANVDGHFSGVDTALGNKQPLDAGLTSISGLTTAADKMLYTTGSDTYAVADLTSAGRALLDDADAAAQRTTLELGSAATSASSDFLASTAGLDDLSDVTITSAASGNLLQHNGSGQFVNVAKNTIDVGSFNDDSTYQPLDAGLTSISGLTTSANKMVYTTASDTYAVADLTAAGRALLDDADAAAQRTTLELGSAATSASTDFLASTAGLNNLSDVTISSVSNGQVISYNSTSGEWENSTPASGNQITDVEIKTGSSFTAASNYIYLCSYTSGTQTITFPAASSSNDGDLIALFSNNASRSVSIVSSDGTTNDISDINNASKGGTNGGLSLDIDRQLVWFSPSGTLWRQLNAAPATVATTGAYSDLSGTPTLGTAASSDTSDFLASTAGLNNLSDVTISSVSNGQVISYNSTSGEWENSTPASGGATDLDGLSDVTITSAASGNLLQHNGSGQFVNVAKNTIDVGSFNDDGTYLNDVIDDTTPQLGGDLDVNANEIISASNNNVVIRPNGTGVVALGGNTNPAELRFYCETTDQHYVGFKSPAHASLTGSQTWTLPTADGTSGQVIKTDGSGVLSFVDQASGGGTSYTYSAITNAASPVTAQAWYHYSVDTSGGAVTINLPALSGLTDGDEIRVKLREATNSVTIDANGTEEIDGSETYTLDVAYSAVTLVVGSTEWEVI